MINIGVNIVAIFFIMAITLIPAYIYEISTLSPGPVTTGLNGMPDTHTNSLFIISQARAMICGYGAKNMSMCVWAET
jgi:hypothetical protein